MNDGVKEGSDRSYGNDGGRCELSKCKRDEVQINKDSERKQEL